MNSGAENQALAAGVVGLPISIALLVLFIAWMLRRAVLASSNSHSHPVLQPLLHDVRHRGDETPAPSSRLLDRHGGRVAVACALALLSSSIAFYLAGPVAGVVGGAAGAWVPFGLELRRARDRRKLLEEQFAEFAEGMALAVRGGLSIPHAMEFAAEDAEDPLREVLHRTLADHRLGSSFASVLHHLMKALPTNETRLFTVVLHLHAKSGGNLAESLDQVASAIRSRMEAHRDLQALSAQGRMSGVILASLPIGFFFVLAVSSRSDMWPVLRSSTGIALVSAGLSLQAVGYAWIRRLLRVRL